MVRQKFEESFRDAFNHAEVAPSDSVWVNVELDLEKTSGGKMKRRLLFFQLLAAASMVFAMGVGSVYYLKTSPDTAQPLTQQPSIHAEKNSNSITQQQSINSDVDNTKSNEAIRNRENNNSGSNQGVPESNNALMAISTERSTEAVNPSVQSETLLAINRQHEVRTSNRSLPSLVNVEEPRLKVPVTEPDPGMVLLAKLRDEEKKFQKEEPVIEERVWTSIGMGAGTFNPNTTSAPVSLSSFGNPASSSNPSSGSSYSIGLSVATKVSKRIVVQGGVSYLTQNAEYTSSAVSGGYASLNEFVSSDNREISATSPYQVNSNLQFMSIPLQAGYIVVDRTFAVQLNGGFSTDLFIQSTLTPDNSSVDKVSQGAGSDSPYRTVNFSGLVGTELSYKVGNHYRIAVNPGLRYALNSIYRSEMSTETSPVTFDVALRFRYIFK